MMMTLRPMSVTSLEPSSLNHVTTVDPVRLWSVQEEPAMPSSIGPSTGQRKRLKSSGDSGRVVISAPMDPGKKSILSLFGKSLKSKNKSTKTRTNDSVSSSQLEEIKGEKAGSMQDAPPTSSINSSRVVGHSEAGTENNTRETNNYTNSEEISTTFSFAAKKGFQRSISIPVSSGSFNAKKDARSGNTFQVGDGYEDFPCKFDCPQTPVKLLTTRSQPVMEIAGSPSLGPVLQALSGPPLNNKPEDGQVATNGSDDRSPLIDREMTTERLAAIAATSFDNIASVTETDQSLVGHQASQNVGVASCGSGNTSPASVITTASSTPSATVFFPNSGNVPLSSSSSEKAHGHTSSWWSISKGNSSLASKPPSLSTGNSNSNSGAAKKRKPRLSIMLPSSKETGGMRLLSAAEERKIDEAMQLASHLARMSTNDHASLPSPRSVSGSSKESLESPAVTSTTSSFFFGGFRRRAVPEKRTFADGLTLPLGIDAAERMFTADAQTAYNQLVASSPPATGCDSVTSKAPSSRRHEIRSHRLQMLEAPLPRHHQRSSLSESDQGLVASVTVPLAFQTVDERRPHGKRSLSLSDDAPTFHIEITPTTSSLAASDSTLSPPTSVKTASTDRLAETNAKDDGETVQSTVDRESVPDERAPSPPPRLPPRVPLRQSTINAKPRQRKHPLGSTTSGISSSTTSARIPTQQSHHHTTSVNNKLRSISEALPCPQPPRFNSGARVVTSKPPSSQDVVLPRRITKSAADVDDGARRLVSSVSSDTSSNQPLNETQLSTSSDDGSVFVTDRDDNDDDAPPSSPAPLPPRGGSQQPPLYPRRSVGLRETLARSTIAKTRFNARQLGFDDDHDAFWTNPLDFRQINRGAPSNLAALSQSEEDLLNQLVTRPSPSRYDTSDDVSYEDLMEFALDALAPHIRKSQTDDGECDEVRLMRKLLSKDVSIEECVDALSDTRWDVYSAIKLIKLNKLLSTGLADEQLSKRVLLSCRWNVDEAVAILASS